MNEQGGNSPPKKTLLDFCIAAYILNYTFFTYLVDVPLCTILYYVLQCVKQDIMWSAMVGPDWILTVSVPFCHKSYIICHSKLDYKHRSMK